MRGWILALALVGCGGATPTNAPPENTAVVPPSHGVLVAKTGVFVDGVMVSRLSEIGANQARLANAIRTAEAAPSMPPEIVELVVDTEGTTASSVREVLGAFRAAGRGASVSTRNDSADGKVPTYRCPQLEVGAPPTVAPEIEEVVHLQIVAGAGHSQIRLTRVNETQEVADLAGAPDFARLHALLVEQKDSAFFSDRTDADLQAPETLPAEHYVHFIDIACYAGFTKLVLLPPA